MPTVSYLTLPVIVLPVPTGRGTNVRVGPGGTVRASRNMDVDEYRVTIQHPLLTNAQVEELNNYYEVNKGNPIDVPHGDRIFRIMLTHGPDAKFHEGSSVLQTVTLRGLGYKVV